MPLPKRAATWDAKQRFKALGTVADKACSGYPSVINEEMLHTGSNAPHCRANIYRRSESFSCESCTATGYATHHTTIRPEEAALQSASTAFVTPTETIPTVIYNSASG